MEISFILPSLSFSGGVRVVFDYADRLQQRGHDVKIVAPKIPPHPLTYLRRVGLSTTFSKFVQTQNTDFNMQWGTDVEVVEIPYFSGTVTRFLSAAVSDSDIVIATEWRTAKPVCALDIDAKKYHFVQHYEVHGLWNCARCWNEGTAKKEDPDDPLDFAMLNVENTHSHNREKAKVDRALRCPLPKIVISTFLERVITEHVGQPIASKIPNGVDFDTFYCEGEPDYRSVLAPYRNTKHKGSDDAIEAFKKIRSRRSNVDFAMFGPVEANLPDWIEYHHSISDDELRRLYSDSGIFLFPSWCEGFGLPVAEAMACRSAIVTTNVGAVPDLGVSGRHFLTSPPRSPESLAANVIRFIDNPDEAATFAERAEDRISSFEWERSVDQFEQVLGC